VAYLGFDAVSTAAQEAINPQRDMPKGILGSLAISTFLYILVAFVLTGIVPYAQLNVPDPIALGVNTAGSGLVWLRPIIKIGAVAGLSSVMLVLLLGQPRILFTMAHDGLLPAKFGAVHQKFKTPYLSTIVSGLAAALVAGILPIGILGELVSIGTLFAFVIVCSGVVILRYTHPDTPRPFKVPCFPYVPIMGALISLAQMVALPKDTWYRLIIWLLIGLVIYFAYGLKNSKLRKSVS
ncbi:MAG: amino acid permease, partial [SAR324 cluster bacterium]|nr:amino acid permease [SAR324 cluster bacterium]